MWMNSQKDRSTYPNGCRKYDIELEPSRRLYGLWTFISNIFFKTRNIKILKIVQAYKKNEKKLPSTTCIARYFVFEQMINFIAVLISLIYMDIYLCFNYVKNNFYYWWYWSIAEIKQCTISHCCVVSFSFLASFCISFIQSYI